VQQFRAERDAALESYHEALKLFKAVGSNLGEAVTLRRTGHLQLSSNRIKEAEASYTASLNLCRIIEDHLGKAYALRALGDVAFYHDDFRQAHNNYEDAKQIFRQIGDSLGDANAVMSLARLKFIETHDLDLVEPDLNYVFSARQKMNDLASEGEDYLGFAVALISIQMWAEASTYISKARSAFESVDEKTLLDEVLYFEHGIDKTRKALEVLDKNKANAKKLLLEAKLEFQHVGDFLLYKFIDRLIAACDE
jgi:tetratricopeptide (TPR) repeat protein